MENESPSVTIMNVIAKKKKKISGVDELGILYLVIYKAPVIDA